LDFSGCDPLDSAIAADPEMVIKLHATELHVR
jgi:hypothetical protein